MPAPVTTLGDWNYQPHESIPNALTFTDANNRPMTLTGGAATELAQRVDEFKAMRERAAQVGPQKTAQVAPPSPGGWATGLNDWAQTATDAGGGANAPDQIEANAQAAMQRFGGQFGAPATTVPASAMTPAAATQSVALTPGAGYRNLGFGRRLSPQGTIQRYGGGSPAVTKEMLEQRRADLVAMPTGMSASRSGGFEPSKEYLEEKAQIYTERADLAEQIRGENARKILAEQSDRANQQKLAAEQLADQQKLQQEIDSRVKKDEEIAERARKEYSSAGVNPGRLFQGEAGSARALVSGIASALGAAGAVLGRVDNFAQKMIDSAIERDIRAQENEIAVKRDATDNAMAQLQRSGLTRDQSRLVLRQAQRDWVAAQAESMRVAAKLDENSSQYQNLMLGLRDEEADFREKYRQLSLGTRAEQVTSGFVGPRAATAGGWRDVPDQIGEGKALQGIRETEADIAKKQAEAAAGPDQKSIPTERTTKIADNIQAILQAQKVKGMLGTGDSETFDASGSLTPRSFDSGANYAALEQATQALITTEQKASGIGSTEDDRQNVANKVVGNKTVNSRRRGVEMIAEDAARRTVTEMSGLSPAEQARILEGMPADARALVLQQMSK